MKTKDYRLDIKEITDDGRFRGMASVFGVKDLDDEVVDPGAFTRTLAHKGGEYPLLWQHKKDEPIGLATLRQTDKGLELDGQLNLEVQRAREAYGLLKQKAVRGISYGFKTIKSSIDKTVRHLKEIKLWEVSLVTFPANPDAVVTEVKAEQLAEELKADGTEVQTLIFPKAHWETEGKSVV